MKFFLLPTRYLINRPGLFYGQCWEICGANHRFIPIVIERFSTNKFITCFQPSDDYSLILEIQLVNLFVEIISIKIGMNLWFAPLISEHWP